MKWLFLPLALVAVCLTEARAEAEDDIGENVRAVVTDMPVTDGFLLLERPLHDASTDAQNEPTNTTLSPNARFEQLMSACSRDRVLLRATAWDLVLVVAVVAVSLAEARLLCVVFSGLQLQGGGKGDVKSVRLTLQSATPPNRTLNGASNTHPSSALVSAQRRYTSY